MHTHMTYISSTSAQETSFLSALLSSVHFAAEQCLLCWVLVVLHKFLKIIRVDHQSQSIFQGSLSHSLLPLSSFLVLPPKAFKSVSGTQPGQNFFQANCNVCLETISCLGNEVLCNGGWESDSKTGRLTAFELRLIFDIGGEILPKFLFDLEGIIVFFSKCYLTFILRVF